MQDSTFVQSIAGTKAKSAVAKSNSNPNSKPKPKPKPKPKTNVASTSFNPDDTIPPVQCQASSEDIYNNLYQPKSSVLRSTSMSSTWEGSGIFFTNYMNRNYLPRIQRHLGELRPFVYLSRPDQSVLTQMKGACDVFLLAILNNRPFQCPFHPLHSSTDYANLLPPHFFASPLYYPVYPITLPDSGIPKKPSILHPECGRLQFAAFRNVPSISDYVDLSHTSKGVSDGNDFAKFHAGSVGIASNGDIFPRFFGNHFYLNRLKEMVKSLKTSSFVRMQTNWYSMAMPNLFAPSEYMRLELKSMFAMLQTSRVVGVCFELETLRKQMTEEEAMKRLEGRVEVIRELSNREESKIFVVTDSEEAEKAIEKEFGKKVVKIQGEKWKKGQAVSEQRLKTFFKEVMVLGKIVRLVLTRNGEVGTVAMHLHTISPRIYYF